MSIIQINEPHDYSCGHHCKYFRGQKFVKGVRGHKVAEKLVIAGLKENCKKEPNAPAGVAFHCTVSCGLNLAIKELTPEESLMIQKGEDVHRADEGKIIKLN